MPWGDFDEHLAQNEDPAAGEIRPGQWIGAGAEWLGLNNAVTRNQFHALCENQNPPDNKRLTQRQEKTKQWRVLHDFTCSAPKSVSVLAVTMDDERLVSAHKEATRIAFRELETFAATRVRKQGNQRDRITANLVAAACTKIAGLLTFITGWSSRVHGPLTQPETAKPVWFAELM
jgi:conjugative relaxase-like TrwC/TraI family protein